MVATSRNRLCVRVLAPARMEIRRREGRPTPACENGANRLLPRGMSCVVARRECVRWLCVDAGPG